MAASDYELKILTYDFVDETKKQVECRFDWGGLAGTERDYTEKLEVFVRYHVVNNAGERRIDREDPATTITAIPGQTEYVYYWDVPDRCIEVEMRVVAYSKMMNSNGNEVPHWNVGRTIEKATDWLYCGESNKPDKADTPTITQNPRLGNQVVLELSGIIDPDGPNKDVKKVEFQILEVENDEDDGTIVSGQHEATVSSFNTCRYVMSIGNAYGYRFRARLWASKYGSVVGVENPWAANASPVVDIPGEWSDLSDIVHGAPNSPVIVDMKKQNRTQVLITLKKSGYLHHYQFQVASTTEAFTRMDTWELEHPELVEDESARQEARALPPPILDEFDPDSGDTESILYTATQLPGGKLFYRVRAVSAESGGFYSGWSAIYEYKFSEELQKPIVWMNTPFASVGDNSIILNIMHNSPTGTQTTGAQIWYRINSGILRPYPAEGIIDPPANSNVYQVAFPLTDFDEDCAIYWQARTAEYGEAGQDERNWSELSEGLIFWVYEKPVLNITFPDIPQDEWIPAVTEDNAQTIPVVSQFPFHFRVTPVLSGDQMITSYFVRLMAVEAYGEYDGYGNKRFVNKGEVLYQFHDNSLTVDKYLSVTDCSLANGQRYILSVSAYVNTGVTVEAEAMFTVNITPADYVIEAVVGENRENVTMIINPAAVTYEEKVVPLDIPRWEDDNTPFEVSDKFISDGTDYWLYNNILYGGTSLEYNPETSTLNQFHWDKYVDNKYLLSNQFWVSEDGTAYGMAGDYPAILDIESDEWILDSRITPYGTSEPQMRFKYFNADTESYEDRLLIITNGTVTMHKFENGDWTDVSSLTPQSDATNGIGSNVWNFVMISPDGEYLAASVLSDGSHDYVVQDGAIADVTSVFANHLAGYNVWNLEDRMFWSGGSTHYELDTSSYPYEWKTVTWNGLTFFYGSYVRIINGIAYTVRNNYLYRLDIENMEWIQIRCFSEDYSYYYGFQGSEVWTDGTDIRYDLSLIFNSTEHRWDIDKLTGLSGTFYGYDVWTDGTNIYHSYYNKHYILDKSTKTWSSVTFTGQTSFHGVDIFHVDNKTYLAHDSTDSKTHYYELDTTNLSWTQKTWNGNAPDPNGISGRHIWHHAGLIMSASNSAFRRYTLDPETMQWSRYGNMSDPYMSAEDIWTDGVNTYITGYGVSSHGRYSTFILNEETLEWEYIHLEGWPDDGDYHSGSDVWHDLEGNTYYMHLDHGVKKFVGTETIQERIYVDDILLSIYRKNQDGTMVAIAENFENQDSVFVTDPHPNLMKNSYRIVGRDKNTGAMTFVDTPEYQMHCTDIIIQWDENVHFTDVTENSLPAEYAGNTIRLPYNIDVSESANIENNMVNYVGRKNPVSYYGTQTGYTATWNTVIPKSDRDTIALLRKLQVYPGDVYVREPSGTGYWAHVTVTFPINHVELTVSVSLSITRVEGGM